MSFSTLTNRVSYTGDGATSVFAYGFPIIAQSDLLVTKRLLATGVETVLVLTTDYTVTGVGMASGGNVTLVAGALAATYRLVIRRVRPLSQVTDIRNQGDFYPETHEDAFDNIVMVAQQLQSQIDRCAKLVETLTSSDFDPTLPSTVSASPGKFLGIAASGLAWSLYDSDSVSNPSAEVQHAITDAQAATALTGQTVDGAVNTSAIYFYEILRGTTVLSTGFFSMHYRNSTWELVMGEDRMADAASAHGVTFSISQSTTVGQLKAALDAGAGNGKIKLRRSLFSV